MPDSSTLIGLDEKFACLADHYNLRSLHFMALGEGYDSLEQMLEDKFNEAVGRYYDMRSGAKFARSDLKETRYLTVRTILKSGATLKRCLEVDAIDWVMENT